ncbi:formyltransferase family protein [Verrucomicrobia bacterium]|nr:formyltransferase family protein [Verrucomicrobiota bacterium]
MNSNLVTNSKFKIAVIGRGESLFNTAKLLIKNGYNIKVIITDKSSEHHKKGEEDFLKLANEINAEFLSTTKINDASTLITEQKVNIGISANYSRIINSKFIKNFEFGVLNAHGGDLPRYRGNACQAWAILNNENKIGLCVHKMIGASVDEGDIIARDYMTIDSNTKINVILKWTASQIPNLYLKALNELSINSEFILCKQNSKTENSLRCYPRIPSDGKINWEKSAESIQSLVNASGPPFEGAYTFYNKIKISILDCEKINDYPPYCAVPGQILKIEKKHIEVATSSGPIKIKQAMVNSENIEFCKYFKSIRTRFN